MGLRFLSSSVFVGICWYPLSTLHRQCCGFDLEVHKHSVNMDKHLHRLTALDVFHACLRATTGRNRVVTNFSRFSMRGCVLVWEGVLQVLESAPFSWIPVAKKKFVAFCSLLFARFPSWVSASKVSNTNSPGATFFKRKVFQTKGLKNKVPEDKLTSFSRKGFCGEGGLLPRRRRFNCQVFKKQVPKSPRQCFQSTSIFDNFAAPVNKSCPAFFQDIMGLCSLILYRRFIQMGDFCMCLSRVTKGIWGAKQACQAQC